MPDPPKVRELRVRVKPQATCPACGGLMRVASTGKDLRRLKCTTCGQTGKQARRPGDDIYRTIPTN